MLKDFLKLFLKIIILWDRAEVAYQAHNLKVGGSNPSPATMPSINKPRSVDFKGKTRSL